MPWVEFQTPTRQKVKSRKHACGFLLSKGYYLKQELTGYADGIRIVIKAIEASATIKIGIPLLVL